MLFIKELVFYMPKLGKTQVNPSKPNLKYILLVNTNLWGNLLKLVLLLGYLSVMSIGCPN